VRVLPLPTNVRALLVDADGCLFPAQDPVHGASMQAVNALLAEVGVARRYTASELRRDQAGHDFRSVAPLLAAENGVELEPGVLERWVGIEREAVTRRLARSLRPDHEVESSLRRLADEMSVAVVTSGSPSRVRACLRATGLSDLVPPDRLFGAEDSPSYPADEPDPAVHRRAGEQLAVTGREALAVEDSEAGVRSAVAAGFPVLGLVRFVPAAEAPARARALRAAGAAEVVDTWSALVALLLPAVTSGSGIGDHGAARPR
jgi:HAD superfamily hydrolase (TIGR01509 family)